VGDTVDAGLHEKLDAGVGELRPALCVRWRHAPILWHYP
jgi:hypothetical protein